MAFNKRRAFARDRCDAVLIFSAVARHRQHRHFYRFAAHHKDCADVRGIDHVSSTARPGLDPYFTQMKPEDLGTEKRGKARTRNNTTLNDRDRDSDSDSDVNRGRFLPGS